MDRLMCKRGFVATNVNFNRGEMYFYWTNFGGLNHFISDTYGPGGKTIPFDGEISRHSDRPYLYDYFYTKEEMRDLKINEIITC